MLRRLSVVVAIGIVFAVVVILAGDSRVAHTSPPANQSVQWDATDTVQHVHVVCTECHTMEESLSPWMVHIAPTSLMIGCSMSRGTWR